jgi:tubulin polyglutamylase complex subunit 2
MALRDSGKDSNSESDEQEITVTKKRIRRGKHELFDKIAFNVLSYLESFDEVGDIDISVPDGSPTFSAVWEGKHAPYVLPFDIKGFSALFNGLSLKWFVDVGTSSVGVGEIQVNKLEAMVEVELCGKFLPFTEGRGGQLLSPDPLTAVAFEIAKAVGGVVAVLFRTKPSLDDEGSSEIWFKDTSTSTATWHFICYTFTQYLRLSILHLGIFGWQRIFTPEGVSMTTRQWMGMFCRERLCVYQHHSAKMNNKGA